MAEPQKEYKIGGEYYTEEELQMIRSVLKDNAPLLKLIRKVFIPTVNPQAPGPLVDVYNPISFRDLDPESAKIAGEARNQLVEHLNTQIGVLWTLANNEPKTEEERKKQEEQNSSR